MTQAAAPAATPDPDTDPAADRAGAASPLAPLLTTRAELTASIAAGVLLGLGFLLERAFDQAWAATLIWISLAIGMFYGGRAAAAALRARAVDIDVLMVVAAGLAAALGHPEEGALLLFLFTLSGALEDAAMARTQRAVEELHKLMPTEALVFRDNAWIETSADTLAAGERIKIRPGERVPTDATVTTGESSLDQSAITGESMPRHVKPGDELFAGTINTDDPIEATVLRPVSESSLQKILDLVTQAREQREPVQRFIDRISQPYAIGVFAVSIAVFLIWWLLLDFPIVGIGDERGGALYVAITLMIVASPCAVIIATPTATLAAIARAARAGVLFKGGQSIERLANMGSVCFDKTGTLTFGRPRLYEVHPVAWSDGGELLAIAAGLEADSTHPIAAAVREAAQQRGIEPATVTDIDHVTARGISGVYQGSAVRLGSYTHAEPIIPTCFRNRVQDVLRKIQHRGHVAVVVARAGPSGTEGQDGQAAVLIMADAVRPGAVDLVEELHELGIKPVRMLTGDNKLTAQRIAESLKLDAFDAELLPQDKLDIVGTMREQAARSGARHSGVAVIGDGVNDAPALAAADVSLGIGTIGTAAALESADIVLLSDNLSAVPWSVRLARRARLTIKFNLIFALSIIIAMAAATLTGSLMGRPIPMALGVLAHEGGTVLVVLNSLLLLAFRGVRAPISAENPPRSSGTPGRSPSHPSDERATMNQESQIAHGSPPPALQKGESALPKA